MCETGKYYLYLNNKKCLFCVWGGKALPQIVAIKLEAQNDLECHCIL